MRAAETVPLVPNAADFGAVARSTAMPSAESPSEVSAVRLRCMDIRQTNQLTATSVRPLAATNTPASAGVRTHPSRSAPCRDDPYRDAVSVAPQISQLTDDSRADNFSEW